MAEYIKREDAKKAILEACGCDYRCMVGCNGACDIHAGSVWGAVDNIPAADVRENVHARWKSTAIGNYACSYCGGEPYYNGNIESYKYCPYCGADNRGEQNGKNG